jgi:hypothetical protein
MTIVTRASLFGSLSTLRMLLVGDDRNDFGEQPLAVLTSSESHVEERS